MKSARLPNQEVRLVCTDCQSEFTAKRRGILRCSPCKLAVAQEHARRARPERRLASDRQFPCHGCGGLFTANRSDAKWCMACQIAKSYAHNNRPRPEKQREPNVQRACPDCGTVFMASLRTVYCEPCRRARNVSSTRRSQAKTDRALCPKCGGEKRRNSKVCRSCNSRSNLPDGVRRGADHPNWKGGRWQDKRGYWHVNIDGATRPEHILVWEQANGPIPTNYVIHHVNGDKGDNRLENLECLSRSAHRSLHDAGDQHRSAHLQERDAEIAQLKTRIRELEGRT